MKNYSEQAKLSLWFNTVETNTRSISGRSLLFGVGNNDANHMIAAHIDGKKVEDPAYILWKSVLSRTYSNKTQKEHPTYVGCCMSEEWLAFSNFKPWFIENHIDGYNLDKDLKIVGNKVYSSNTCLFVPVWLNCFLSDCRSVRGVLPIGVVKDHNTFRARCNNPKTKRREHLGNFKSEQQAYEAWLLKKLEFAFELKTEMDIIHKDIYPNIVKMIKDKV